MTDQELNPSTSLTPNHTPDGKFAPNNLANPTGENGMAKGWQPYGLRLRHFLEMTIADLFKLSKSKSELKKLSGIDGAALRQVMNMLKGIDPRWEREAALDRIEGPIKQLTGLEIVRKKATIDDDFTDAEIEAAYAERMKR